jgi:hypothetical protein
MRRLSPALALIAFLVLAGPGRSGAQTSLPPCEPSTNGKLIKPGLTDPQQRSESTKLYATHRLHANLSATTDEYQAPDGSRYEVDPDSEHLAPGPGVVGSRAFLQDAPGPVTVTAAWTVMRREFFGAIPEPHCIGSESIAATLLKPAPTSIAARLLVTDLAGDGPRVKILIAGRASDDLRPLTVRMRRGARGVARELFTLQLANVTPRAGGYRFRKRFAGVTVQTGPTQLFIDGRGLVTLGVSMPRLHDGRSAKRSFTLELVRDGRLLMRVRAVLACHGRIVGAPPALQECSAPVWRVTRLRG